MSKWTHDTFFRGRISVKQPPDGYRFSVDAVILGNLARLKPGDRILDLGTGCGVIPLILCYRNPELGRVFGVEIQPELAELAAVNTRENRMDDRITILERDVKSITPADTGGPVDAVVCNPPHFAPNSGRINPDSQKAVARHEIRITLPDLTAAAARMLTPGGRMVVIYPSERLVDLLNAMRRANIEPKELRMIHPGPNSQAQRVLVHATLGKNPGVKVGPPLYIRRDARSYTDELEAMFAP
ncbi:MAG: tRNA1(Val) (adenine(37)-N6)-methyltransferase [Desulfobacteraceae bacterium]|nr:tRNA1(Val) (adenine(37)-N6)-methyltransferase [Desulfobacteraceae bacterium]